MRKTRDWEEVFWLWFEPFRIIIKDRVLVTSLMSASHWQVHIYAAGAVDPVRVDASVDAASAIACEAAAAAP